MALPQRPALYDLPQFAGLREVAREFHVDFRLYGGAASRLAMAMVLRPERVPDLVDLAPFISDVDLVHTGPDGLNVHIAAAIEELVPEAPWCRWSIRGREAASSIAARMSESADIPLRRVTFDPVGGAFPEAVLSDLHEGRVTFIPNPGFADSLWRRGEVDLEVFGLLIALQAGADLMEFTGRRPVLDGPTVVAALNRFKENDEPLLRERPALRRRLRYLLAGLAVRRRFASELPLLYLSTLEAALDDPPEAPARGHALVVSAALEGDRFRAPAAVALDDTGDAEVQLFEEFLMMDGPEPVLDEVFDFAGLSEWLKLAPGPAPSSGVGPDGRPREFLHLAWLGAPEEDASLTGFALARGPEGGTDVHLASAVGGTLGGDVSWLRLDIGALVAEGQPAELRVAALAVAASDPMDVEQAAKVKSGSPGEAVQPAYATAMAG